MDEQLIDLINRAIDGEVSPEEAARLRAALASDPGVMEVHDSIRHTVLEIESIRQVEPPAGLRDEILASIRARQDPTGATEPPAVRRLQPRRTPVIRYVWALAAGIVLGFALHPLIVARQAPLDIRQASGTMAPIPASTATAAQISRSVTAQGVRATVTADVTKTTVVVGIHVDAGTTEPLEIDWAPDHFSFDGIRRSAGEPDISLRPGHLEISSPGPSRLDLRLRRIGSGASPVDLRTGPSATSSTPAHVEVIERP